VARSLGLSDDKDFPQFVQNVHFDSTNSPQPWQLSESRSAPPQDPQNRNESGKSKLHFWQCFMTVPFVSARQVDGYPISLTRAPNRVKIFATSSPGSPTAWRFSDD